MYAIPDFVRNVCISVLTRWILPISRNNDWETSLTSPGHDSDITNGTAKRAERRWGCLMKRAQQKGKAYPPTRAKGSDEPPTARFGVAFGFSAER